MTVRLAYPHSFESVIFRKARKLCSYRPYFESHEEEDVAQILRTLADRAARLYDPQRGHWLSYMKTILNNRCKSLLRGRRQKCRNPTREWYSLNETALDRDGRTVQRGDLRSDAYITRSVFDAEEELRVLEQLPSDTHRLIYRELVDGHSAHAIHTRHDLSRRKVLGCIKLICEIKGIDFEERARNSRRHRRISDVADRR